MGNNQSQSSDEEEREPSYRYHEDVLQNAQLLTAENVRVGADIPVYESDNEEYFSAEEGDGDSDRSITPLRTRPESSSGEDFSDDSVDEDDAEDDSGRGISSNVQVAPPSNTSVPFASPGGRVLRSRRTCGQCNVSTFQEHDSIGPELQTSRWHLNDSSLVSNASNTQSRNSAPTNSSDLLSVKRLQHYGTSTSPFVPIQSSPASLNASQTNDNNSSLRAPKRKMSQTPSAEDKRVPPRKRFSNEVSPWKRGLGYFDSSDSDDDVEEISRGRRRSRHSRSPKSARLSTNAIAPPGSKRGAAENLYASSGDFNIGGAMNPKQRRLIDKKALVSAISDSAKSKRSHSGEELECETRLKRLRGQSVEGGGENIPQNSTDLPLSHSHGGSGFRGLEGRQQGGLSAFQAHSAAGDPDGIIQVDDHPAKTLKMGSNCVRNSQGKVVPIRRQSDTHLAHSDEVEENATGIASDHQRLASLTNIIGNLRDRRKSPVETPPEKQIKMNINDIRSAEAGSGGTLNSSREQHSNSCSALGDQSGFNPLATVVLTPTTPTSPTESSPGPAIAGKKRKSQSAAERLKKFWTNSSLGSNFKSIFSSKSKLPLGTSSKVSHQTPSPSLTSASLRHRGYRNQSNNNLFNDSTHMHFSSSPADSVTLKSDGSRSFSMQLRDSASSPSLNLSHVSPIFASFSGKSPSDTSMDRDTQRYSSLLEMSAKAQKRGSQNQTRGCSRMPTRTSPRFQQSSMKSSQSPVDLPSSADIQILPQVSQFQVLHFTLADALEISVSMGDIAEEFSGGIVNWTDESLTHAVTECSRSIAAKAGALMRAGCADYLANKGAWLQAPDVLITPAGGRFPKSVEALLHVVSPQLKRRERPGSPAAHPMTTRLMEVYANCLRFANERLALQSLSLPLIGQDLFTAEVSIKAFFDSLLIYLTENTTECLEDSSMSTPFELTSVHLVISDASNTDLAAELIKASLHHIADQGLENVARETFLSYYPCNDSPKDHQTESIDRTRSGRPRIKRPKL